MATAIPDDVRDEERLRAVDRVVAFSDGVFAIAITLLVLNFDLPEIRGKDVDRRLLEALADDWGVWLSFALSFFIIARFWMSHHRLSLLLRRVDATFIALNLVLLAFVVVLPFPTEIVGEYGDSRTGLVAYATAMTLTGIASGAVWQYAQRAGLMDPRVTASWARHSLLRSLVFPAVFLVSIAVAFVSVTAAQACWSLLFVQHFVFTKRFGDIHEPYEARDRAAGAPG